MHKIKKVVERNAFFIYFYSFMSFYPSVIVPNEFAVFDANMICAIVRPKIAIGPNTLNIYFIGVKSRTNKKVVVSK